MKKLLHLPLRAFLLFSLVILSLSIPVYYVVVESIWMEELDDHNRHIKEQIERQLGREAIPEDSLLKVLRIWNLLQPGTQIEPASESDMKADQSFIEWRKVANSEDEEKDQFRVLSTYIRINGKLFHLRIESDVEETDETLGAIALVTFSFFVLLVLGFIYLNRKITQKSWKSFYQTLSRLQQFDLTQQRPLELSPTEILEFHELNTRLKQLTDSNLAAFIRQKKFIENASHELQTPLAILKSKLDLLFQNPAFDELQAETVNAIQKQISRVSRINRNLLLLAKIENQQFADNETIDLVPLLKEILESITEVFVFDIQQIIIQLPEEFLVTGNRTLMEILINNLLTNALVHNVEKGQIGVQLNENTLRISNTGTKPLEKEALFQRFAISSTRATSSGLGLAIVKEICDRYGWKVGYGFESDMHVFFIQF